MKAKRIATLLAGLALVSAGARSADFFDTSECDRIFSLGVRIGVNTSDNTLDRNTFNLYNKNAWGTGLDLGVVADINVREYLSVQPGFFLQTRSGDYTYARLDAVNMGHYRYAAFNIPVVASVHFNITDDLRWNVDWGPYFALNLSDTKTYLTVGDELSAKISRRPLEFGFKMGTGLTLKRHYYVGVHYLAGCTDIWKQDIFSGRTKAWTFTLGYDF